MAPSKLTERLQSTDEASLKSASQHTFLQKAGAGTLPSEALCAWLVQDKYYQFGYLNFIGRLCSNLELDSYAFPKKGEDNLAWTTFTTLVTALNAIKDEIDFYNETVEKYDLQLQRNDPDETTKAYRKLFSDSSQPGKPITHGLTVLWATEFVYLKAWSHAKSHISKEQDGKGAVAALHQAFIPRWSSDEFKQAVDSLAAVLDRQAEEEPGEVENCEKLWRQVLDLEIKFWPDVS